VLAHKGETFKMTSALDASVEEKRAKQRLYVGKVCEGGLESAVSRMGGELRGFSVKMSGVDVLVTLRADFPAGRMIAFVGGSTLGNALAKAFRDGHSDALRWRVDKWDK
jgi:hypothetical protein